MTYPQIIGLTGVARAGKDTVADILRQLYGYEPRSFSDMLNKALIALNPMVALNPAEFHPEKGPRLLSAGTDGGWTNYATLIEARGYEEAKEEPEVRRLLQRMGTEVGRDLLGEDIWVDALFKDIREDLRQGKKIAITNVRFPNEYDAVSEAGGEVWRVTRPGYEAAQGHISDRAIDGFVMDAVINNEGTVRDLADKVMDRLDDPIRAGLQRSING